MYIYEKELRRDNDISSEVNLQDFQKKVVQELNNLKDYTSGGKVKNGQFLTFSDGTIGEAEFLNIFPAVAAHPPVELDIKDYENKVIVVIGEKYSDFGGLYSARILDDSSAEILSKRDLIKRLCPALQNISNDMFEITKVSTPVLASLSLAGVITLSMNPIIFAVIAMLIARM